MDKRSFAGLDVVIENDVDSVRQWYDRDAGVSGETTMKNAYGYLEGHTGADGEEVDCYLGPNEAAKFVYVVHQKKSPDFARFDEDKVFLGFDSEADAKASYFAHRSERDEAGNCPAYGGMSSMSLEAFKAKLKRRTGSGKIRHEAAKEALVTMAETLMMGWDRSSNDKWELRNTDFSVRKVNGEWKVYRGEVPGPGSFKSATDAIRAVADLGFYSRFHFTSFDAGVSADGDIRVGVWDRVCVPGHDEKDGQSTDFSLLTLSQMVDNAVERGDPIPLDFNHQSQYAAQNGQPAPALAFYGGFAVVWGGKLVKFGIARDVPASPGALYVAPSSATPEGIDLSRDGLWCFRNEVTKLGRQLLPNFKLISPTFASSGTRRDGSDCGYILAAVAATNTPWQSATEITFQKFDQNGRPLCPTCGQVMRKTASNELQCPKGHICDSEDVEKFQTAGKPGTSEKEKGVNMAKLSKLSKFVGMEGSDDDAKIMEALESKMEDTAMAAASDEKFDYDGEAGKFEDAAKCYEDAHMDAKDGDEPPHMTMRKLAANFRRLGKLAKMAEPTAAPDHQEPDGDEKEKMEEAANMAKLESEKDKDAKLSTMEGIVKAQGEQIASLLKSENERKAAAAKENESKFSALADLAEKGGYPKDKRESLIKFARTDFDGARAAVEHLLPKDAPAHLFDRLTRHGEPASPGAPTSARNVPGPSKPKKIHAMGNTFVEDDAEFAAEITRIAKAEDKDTKAKVDALLPEGHRPVMFQRLLAAERIVRKERPDLAEAAE